MLKRVRSLTAGQESAAALLDETLRRCVLKQESWPHRMLIRSCQRLVEYPRQGVYLNGEVGIGKSLLLDGLHEEATRRGVSSIRIHWHEWMSSVNDSLLSKKDKETRTKLRDIGDDWASKHQLVCFDEVAVSDVADALILREIFGRMLDRGVEIVATSNRPPRGLYENGLNRDLFLPFIHLLERKLVLCDLQGESTDHRRTRLAADSFFFVGDNSHERMMACCEQVFGAFKKHKTTARLAYGRKMVVESIGDDVLVASFYELCDRPLAAPDYHALFDSQYRALVLTEIPQLTLERHDQARRFLALVDVLYERKTLLLASSRVDVDHLLLGWRQKEIEASLAQVTVRDQGGSSGRLTTFVGEAEWSATGRIGASLGTFAGVTDTEFAFARLASRLVEMTASSQYRENYSRRRH